MRALILVAGAALAVSACTSKENANNTMNVEENLGTENMAAPDMNATDMNATDMNATTNVGEVSTTNTTTTTTTNNAM
jgi:hypothetical protein